MIILYLFLGLMGLIGAIGLIIAVFTHDYTKDEKGEDIKDNIDDYLLK